MRKLADVLREQERDDPRDLRSRSDARRERKQSEEHLAELARRLTSLKARQLDRLSLPDTLLEAVHAARKISSPVAHARQLRIVRREIRALDPDTLMQAIDDLTRTRRPAAAPGLSQRWVDALLQEGDAALQRFVQRYPNVDRRRLRQLVRASLRSAPGKRSSPGALGDEVARVLAQSGDDEPATSE